MSIHRKSDVTVVGAGPIGLLAAYLMSRKNLTVSLLDKSSEKEIFQPKEDGRAVALNKKTINFFKKIGVWDLIESKHKYPIMRAEVFDGDSNSPLSFESKKSEPIGYFVKNISIRKALCEMTIDNPKISLHYNRNIDKIIHNNHQDITVKCHDETFKQSLLLAADGRFSQLRRFANINYHKKEFKRIMYLVEIKHVLPHHNTAVEQFMYNGFTCAILPLSDFHSSIALTVPQDEYDLITEEEIEYIINQCVEKRIGKVDTIYSSHAYPLISIYAQCFFSNSLALIGDAAIGMHPVTAHGFNLGVYGTKILSECLDNIKVENAFKKKISLTKYQTKLNLNAKPLYHATNQIVNTFTNDNYKFLRKTILTTADKLPLWKKIIYKKIGI